VPGRIDTVRAAAATRASTFVARRPADRPSRPAGRGGGDGAHAVRTRGALYHRAVDPCQWRRLFAMNVPEPS
jgi:hypothetical protein